MAISSNPPDTWPTWTDSPIELFHGTTLISANNIKGGGVRLADCQENSDFGRGFYTTTLRHSAKLMAERRANRDGGQPAVVHLRLNRREMAKLETIAFVRGSLDATDFWSFVYSCRNGLPTATDVRRVYDIACGPVARNWRGPERSAVYEGYDQISFHSEKAILMLNNQQLCSLEIL
jgi:hypothetical protein